TNSKVPTFHGSNSLDLTTSNAASISESEPKAATVAESDELDPVTTVHVFGTLAELHKNPESLCSTCLFVAIKRRSPTPAITKPVPEASPDLTCTTLRLDRSATTSIQDSPALSRAVVSIGGVFFSGASGMGRRDSGVPALACGAVRLLRELSQ